MKAKLIKQNGIGIQTVDGVDYYLVLNDKIYHTNPLTSEIVKGGKLSKQNCDEIFGIVDVEKLCKQEAEKLHDKSKHEDWDVYNCLVYEDTEMIKIGFNKAIELNKDKKFTEDDMIAFALKFSQLKNGEFFKGLNELLNEYSKEPTEIEVEIEKEWKPKSNYCVACGEGGKYMEKPCDHKDDCEHWQPKYKNGFLMVKKLKS